MKQKLKTDKLYVHDSSKVKLKSFRVFQKYQTLDFINNFEKFNSCANCALASKNRCNKKCEANLKEIQDIKLKIRKEIIPLLKPAKLGLMR
ncbi:hypothetical protein LG651_01495 [Tamlana sp. 62-3]|uniref:Uncharacterized protein n=1 Tax=Neotamlana sargassicola TaxID=2883125 RepID=A0A9X1I4X2_9FLAO|nr:hypothetical protein [Tamlana sargassicola]